MRTESEMLRKQGEALMIAGQMINQQADLIDVYADSLKGETNSTMILFYIYKNLNSFQNICQLLQDSTMYLYLWSLDALQ